MVSYCCRSASRRTSSLTAIPRAKLATSRTIHPPSCFKPGPSCIQSMDARMAQTAAANAASKRRNLIQDLCNLSAMKTLPFSVNTFPLDGAHYECWFRLVTLGAWRHREAAQGLEGAAGEVAMYVCRGHGIPRARDLFCHLGL